MSNINQDLQVTHEIIGLLEKSKENLEWVLDDLPSVFLIMDSKGNILKGNSATGMVWNCSIEELYSKNLSEIFEVENWNIFLHKINALVTDAKNKRSQEFELPIGKIDDFQKIFIWSVSKVEITSNDPWIVVVGRDITELRESEKKLSEIFSSIPVGILTLNADSLIEPSSSEYIKVLLGEEQIENRSIADVLFGDKAIDLTTSIKDGVELLKGFANLDINTFDIIRDMLPTRIKIRRSTGDIPLGIKYQPIAYGTKIKRLLIIIEDRTLIEKVEASNNHDRLKEDKVIQRILHLKSISKSILPTLMEDMSNLIPMVSEAVENKNPRGLCNHLHGVKGLARVADFDMIKSNVHDLETEIRAGMVSDCLDWNLYETKLTEIFSEWKETLSIYNAMNVKEVSTTAPISKTGDQDIILADKLENAITREAEQTSKVTSKNTKVQFKWDGIRIPSSIYPSIRIALLHILNNAIDHGIESSAARMKAGKSEVGRIEITAARTDDAIQLTIEDDGGGIDAAKIKAKAVSLGLIAGSEEISERETFALLFHPGFTLKEEVTTISGRGIGLDAVREVVIKLSGTIDIESVHGKGTKFIIKTPLGKNGIPEGGG